MEELKYGNDEVRIVPMPSGGGLYRVELVDGRRKLPKDLQGFFTTSELAKAAVKYAEARRAKQAKEPTTRAEVRDKVNKRGRFTEPKKKEKEESNG